MPIRNLLKTTKFWKENSFLLREFRYFRLVAILALVFTVSAAIFEGFGIGFILSFLQNFINPHARPIKTGIEWIDHWILAANAPVTERLYHISAIILATTFLRSAFNYFGKVYTSLAQARLGYQLRQRIFEQLQTLSLSYYAKTRSSEIVHSITSEAGQLMMAFGVVSNVISKYCIVTVYISSLFLLSWQLTILAVMLFGLLSAGIKMLLGQVREASFERSKAGRWYVAVSLEFINGIRTVQASAAEKFENRRFNNANTALLKATTKDLSVSALIEPLAEGASTAILVTMLILAFTILVPNGQLKPAGLLTFLFVLFRMMPSLRQIESAKVQLNNYQGALCNVRDLLRTDDKTYFENGKVQFSRLKRAIEFVAVDFGYEGSTELVLHNISLTVKRGEMTALVGASGAGKSTLADLIPRFFDPTQGKVLIDGVDLRELEIGSFRRKLSVVSQDTFIFNTSVRNNIAYALDDIEEEAIYEAARQANALEFIQELPEGLETQLGDRGVRLSGGQRQRIAIARALLRNPEILILDEATSALDSVSERLIQESLERLSIGRTVIAIAHRLSTIVRADKVVVLEQGRILEQGGYQELLDQRGKLWKYHQMQHEFSQAG